MTEPTAQGPARSTGTQLPWQQFTLMILRDRSASGWSLLHQEELARALQSRRIPAASLEGTHIGAPDWFMVRLALTEEGLVATAAPGGLPAPGEPVETVVPELARELRATIVVDDGVAVGPDGQEGADETPDMDNSGGEVRYVYAWHGRDLLAARALASGTKHEVTVYEHEGWVVAATDAGVDVAPVDSLARQGTGFPYACASRCGQAWRLEYVAAKGRKAPGLHLVWLPRMEPIVPPGAAGAPSGDVVDLAEWLRTDALDPADLPALPDLPPATVHGLAAAVAEPDGSAFLTRCVELLGLPAVLPVLVDAPTAGPHAAPVRARLQPESLAGVLKGSLRDEFTQEPQGTGPWARLRRFLYRRPGMHLALALTELALALLVLSSFLSSWSEVPVWLRAAAAVMLAVDGIGNAIMAVSQRRRQRHTQV